MAGRQRRRSGDGGRSVCGGEEGGGREWKGGGERRGEEERGRRRGEGEGKGGGQPWRGGGSDGGAAAARAGSRSMVMRSRRAHAKFRTCPRVRATSCAKMGRGSCDIIVSTVSLHVVDASYLVLCVMLNIRPARRDTSARSTKRVWRSRLARRGRGGFDVTYAKYSTRRSICRQSEYRTPPPDVCDA